MSRSNSTSTNHRRIREGPNDATSNDNRCHSYDCHHHAENHNNDDVELRLERIEHMIRLESKAAYRASTTTPGRTRTTTTTTSDDDEMIDCRYKMALWGYELLSFCNMSAETVERTMDCVDRFVVSSSSSSSLSSNSNSTRSNSSTADRCRNRPHHESSSSPASLPQPLLLNKDDVCSEAVRACQTNKKVYQLVFMSSLYLNVKIHEPIAFDPSMVSVKLSKSMYTPLQIENMEAVLLETLHWSIHRPTVTAYIYETLPLVSSMVVVPNARSSSGINTPASGTNSPTSSYGAIVSNNASVNETFHDLLHRQVKLLVLDHQFVRVPCSVKAYCVMINALEYLLDPLGITTTVFDTIIDTLGSILLRPVPQPNHDDNNNGTNNHPKNRDYFPMGSIHSMRRKLYEMMIRGEISSSLSSSSSSTDENDDGDDDEGAGGRRKTSSDETTATTLTSTPTTIANTAGKVGVSLQDISPASPRSVNAVDDDDVLVDT